MEKEIFITAKEGAKLFGVSPRTIEDWRTDRKLEKRGERPTRYRAENLYSLAEIERLANKPSQKKILNQVDLSITTRKQVKDLARKESLFLYVLMRKIIETEGQIFFANSDFLVGCSVSRYNEIDKKSVVIERDLLAKVKKDLASFNQGKNYQLSLVELLGVIVDKYYQKIYSK